MPTTIPGDAWGGAFLGCVLPALFDGRPYGGTLDEVTFLRLTHGRVGAKIVTPDDVVSGCLPSNLLLDLTREEPAQRVVRVARAQGHDLSALLPPALNGKAPEAVEETACANCWAGGGTVNPVDCACFPNDGKLRRPVPAATVAALCLARSVERIAVGLPPVTEIWRIEAVLDIGGTCYRVVRVLPTDTASTVVSDLDAFVRISGVALLDPAAPHGLVLPLSTRENP